MNILREDEYEPLRLKHRYPPLPDHASLRRVGNKTGGGRKPAYTKEERRQIAMEPGATPDVAEKYGMSKSYVFTCRREFQDERNAAGLAGNLPAYDLADQLKIALTDGRQSAIARQFGISSATLWAYRKRFRKERIEAGLESTEGSPTVQRAVPSEVVAGGTPDDEPLAAKNSRGHIKDWLL